MSLLSVLELIGGGVAAPFTGGATLPIALQGLSSTLGGAAAGDQKAQASEDQGLLGKAGVQLNRDKFAATAPATRLKTGLLASLGNNATPATVNWGGPGSGLKGQVPTFSGGIKSIYGAEADPTQKTLNNTVLQDMLEQELRGGASGGNADASIGDAANVGQESTGSKILGAGALGTGILAALLKAKGAGSAPVPGLPPTGMTDVYGNPQD